MKKNLKARVISFFMSFAMLFQILPITVFAAMNPPTIVSIGEIAVDQETNMGGAPTVIKGQAYSAQVVATGAELTYTAGVGSYMTLPAGLTINSETGLISGNCTAENGRYDVYIEVSNPAGKTHAVVGMTVGDSTLIPVITAEEGSVGSAYKDTYSYFEISMNNENAAASDIYNFEWSLVSGTLPIGMNMLYTKMPTMVISGTPTETGTFTFELKAENDFGYATRTFSIEVVEGAVRPNIINPGESLGYSIVGKPFEYQLEATGTNTLENQILWSTDTNDFTQESYDLGNGLSMSKTGHITGTPTEVGTVAFIVYAKNSEGKDSKYLYVNVYENGEATSVSLIPEIVVVEKGSTKEFTVSLEGYGDVKQEAYWNFYYYDGELGSAFPQPTDSELSVDGKTPSKSVILTVGENEEREQFRVVAYSKSGNNGARGYATVTVINGAQIIEKTELNSITGTSSLDEFLVEGGILPDTSAPAMPILLDVGKNYNMETTWQKKNGENWIACEVGDTIEQNGEYRLATTIIVDEEEFEEYKPAASISLTIDGKAWTTEAPITGADEFHFRAFSPTFILENANSIFTVQPEDGDVNVNSTYTVNWGLKYEPDDAPIIQFNDNGNWTTLVSSANKTSKEVTVPGESSPIVRQCRVLATYQNASQDPFYVYSDEFTITWHGKYTITVINGAAYDAYDQMTDSASFGDTVMLKANDIDGKTFKNWSITGATVDDENAKNVYMVMPKNNVTAEAIYINNSEYTFVNQPQSATLEYNEKYIGTWSLNFEPTSVQIEKYDQFGNWNYIAMATATGGEIDGYDFNVSNKYRIVAYNNGEAVYSDEFTVTWEKQEVTYLITLIGHDITNENTAGGKLYLETDKGSGLNNGTLYVEQRATENTNVIINAEADSGYEFVEWKLGGPTGSTVTTDTNYEFTANEQVYLYAIFEEIPTYTVTFNTNGGSAVDTQNIKNGEKVTKPSNPTKDNATFFAWYKDAELTEKFDFESETITEPTTIYAGWTVYVYAHTYNVTTDETNTDTAGTFKLSGVAEDGYNNSYGCIEGKEYTITATPKEGYDFVGWKSGAKDGEVLTTEKAYTFTAPSPKLYAVFKKQIYTVTFETNGGSAVDSQNIAKGEKVTKPSNPTKDNATFFAWYKDAELTEKFDFESETITEPTTIYAGWTVYVYAHTYNVTTDETNTDTAGTFKLSGVAEDGYNKSYGCIEGKEYTITATPKEGYDFVGWKSGTKDGEVLTTEKTYTFTAPSPKLYAVFSVIVPTGNIEAPEFDTQEKGYEELTYKFITITLDNNSLVDLEHVEVELTGTNANAYEIDLGPKVLLKGPGTWKDKICVRPITGLEVGTYNATITLKYDCDKDEEYETVVGSANLTFTVNELQPQLQQITSIDVITSGYAIGEEITSAEVTTTTEGVTIESYEWHDNSEPSNKLESGIFEANTQYRLQVFLNVNDGYTAEGLEKANVKVDGKETSYFTNPCIGVDADNGDIKIYHYLDMLEAPTTYTITWLDEDGVTELEKDENVEEGTLPSYDGEEPTKEADAENTYTFKGWTPEVVAVTGDATYTATYEATPIPQPEKYTITWLDEDGVTELEKDENVEEGTLPSYDGEEPTKEADAENTYTFKGWTPEVVAVTGDATYTATYEATPIPQPEKYTITWLDEDGVTVLEKDENVEEGTLPSYDGEEPTKEADAENTYTFKGWTPEVVAVTGDATYTTTYEATPIPQPEKYTVSFNSNGGSAVANIENVLDGSTITAPTAPTKSGYTFAGWYKEAELTNEFNFATDTIIEDTTLFAKWNKKQTTGGGGGGGSTTTKYTLTVKQNDNGAISPETTKVEKGDNQKFEIKADKGYEVEKVLVDGKSVGAVTEYTFENVKAKHTIEATFKKVKVTEKTWKNPFTDVKEKDWYYEAVKFANENKLFNGVSSTEFGPNVNMTRGMLVTVLYRLEGEPATNRSIPFADVDMSMYYANAISWAKQNNIVNGVDETNFAPNAQISREQLVAILYRYAKAKGIDVSVGEETNILSYDDVNGVSEYAIPAMQWGCGTGIITGRTVSTLAPQGTATRAEVATMLMRFVK